MNRKLFWTLGFCTFGSWLLAGTDFEKSAEKADFVVLSDETHVDVADNGSGKFRVSKRIKIGNEEGALANRIIKYDYDPLTAFAEFEFVRVIAPDGSVRELDCSEACDYAAPARAIYWGARQIMLGVGSLNPGDILEYAISKKGFTYALLDGRNASGGLGAMTENSEGEEKFIPPMCGEFYDIVPFWATDAPVAKKEYSVSIRKPLQYKFYRGNVAPEVRFLENGKTEYRFTSEEILPFEKEADMVDLFDAAPKLQLTTTPSWREKSLWFHRVNEDFGSFLPTPSAQKKVDEIISGAKNDREKISRLTHWVADNMRYSGISMGKGEGYTLHPTDMNFTDRCGVCKDKAALLISMLRMAGFEACPAMTMAGSRIESLPADHFNHSVTLVKIDGKWEPLDPTWVPFVRELWSSAESQQHYLPGVPEGSDLCETPIAPAENHYLRVNVTGTLSEDGTLNADYVLEAEGQTDFRIRRAYCEGYVEDWVARIEKEIYAIAPNVEIQSIELGNDWRNYLEMPLKLRVKLKIPHYAASSDGVLVYEPVVFKNVFSQGRRYEKIDTKLECRKYGFKDSCSRTAEFSEKIKLPFNAKEMAREEKSEGDSATFAGTLRVGGDELNYEQKLVMNKRVYEASEWKDVRDALRAYEKFSQKSLVIKKQ